MVLHSGEHGGEGAVEAAAEDVVREGLAVLVAEGDVLQRLVAGGGELDVVAAQQAEDGLQDAAVEHEQVRAEPGGRPRSEWKVATLIFKFYGNT